MEIFPEACIILNAQWYIVKMNQQAEETFLLPKDYIMSKSFWELAPQYINTNMFTNLHKVKQGKVSKIIFEVPGSTSGRRFRLTAQNVGEYIIVFFRDITTIKHTQDELIRSEERFSAAFKRNPALMAIISLADSRYVAINDAYTRHTGYLAEEIIGRTKEEHSLFWYSSSGQPGEPFINNEPVRELTLFYKTKANQYRSVLLSSENIDLNGIPCSLLVGIDITDTVILQQEYMNLERLNMVGQMAAGIAHEIRNPLTIAKGFLQLLHTKDDITHYYTYFEMIISELNRINQIISEFLSLSRFKPTQLRIQDLNSIVKEVLPLIQVQALKEDKILTAELNDIPMVSLDENEIKQVILNLTKNGLEATPIKKAVTIATSLDANSVILSVSDQGGGIPPEIQNKIGSPFFTTKADGTGLGLTICFSIAERHQAQLNYTSSEHGTIFKMYFPVAKL